MSETEETDQMKGIGARARFDPSKYLRVLKGKGGEVEYLDVRYRLLWLRTEHPDAEIVTEHVTITEELAIFKARVSIPSGGSATGYGSETVADFRDHIEKSETKALGRALGALGYGTQFARDFDMETPEGAIAVVDTPLEGARARGNVDVRSIRERGEGGQGQGGGNQLSPATERQMRFIHVIAREAGLDERELHDWSAELYGMGTAELNRRDASALIEALQRRRNERQ